MARPMEKFREMGRNELEIQERELADNIFRLRFQLTTGQAESLKKMRVAKKDLARVKTLLRAQDMGLEKGYAQPPAAAPDAKAQAKAAAKAEAKARKKAKAAKPAGPRVSHKRKKKAAKAT